MANTVSNLLYITGSLAERDRLVGGIIRAGGAEAMLGAHASKPWMSLGASEPYAGGYIYDVAPSHQDGYTTFRFYSDGDAQFTWLESVAAVFSDLTFELLVGSLMNFVAYSRYEDGRRLVDEVEPDYRASEFCKKHGWPGWWTPLWDETLDPSYDTPDGMPAGSELARGHEDIAYVPGLLADTLELDFPSDNELSEPARDTEYPLQRW